MKVGQTITSGEEAPIETGNRLPLKNIPVGSTIHAIELKVGGGAQMVRSAGNSAQLMAKRRRLRPGAPAKRRSSSDQRRIAPLAIGVIGNEQHQNVKIGKAGRNRHKGKRPSVRGVVMNAADHPHGGGDGGRHGMAVKTIRADAMGSEDPRLQDPPPQEHQSIYRKKPSRGEEEIIMSMKD